jgi:hypothetical protein
MSALLFILLLILVIATVKIALKKDPKKEIRTALERRGIFGVESNGRYNIPLENLSKLWVQEDEEDNENISVQPSPKQPQSPPQPKTYLETVSIVQEKADDEFPPEAREEDLPDTEDGIPEKEDNKPIPAEKETITPEEDNPLDWIDVRALVDELHKTANVLLEGKYHELFTYDKTAYVETKILYKRIEALAKEKGQVIATEEGLGAIYRLFRREGYLKEGVIPKGQYQMRYYLYKIGKTSCHKSGYFIPLKAEYFAGTEDRKTGYLSEIDKIVIKSETPQENDI